MRPIKEVINELKKYPENSKVLAYEGEDNGISIHDENENYIGFISLTNKQDEHEKRT